jgi:hypothetical protein
MVKMKYAAITIEELKNPTLGNLRSCGSHPAVCADTSVALSYGISDACRYITCV